MSFFVSGPSPGSHTALVVMSPVIWDPPSVSSCLSRPWHFWGRAVVSYFVRWPSIWGYLKTSWRKGHLWWACRKGTWQTEMEGGPFLPGERGAGTSVLEHAAVVFLLPYMYKEREPELTGYLVTPPCPAPAALGLACLPAARKSSPQSSSPASRCSLLCCWIQALASWVLELLCFRSAFARLQSGDIGSYTCFTFLIVTIVFAKT